MKVLLPNDSRSVGVGGGWSFRNNLTAAIPDWITEDEHEADVAIVSGITMITSQTFNRLRDKMKIILRVDGIPEPWRNPRINVGARFRDWASKSDMLIYQSNYVKDVIGRMIDPKGRKQSKVIYNGVDIKIFNKTDAVNNENEICYVYWRDDPNKRPEEVITRFREAYAKNNNKKLTWIGKAPSFRGDSLFVYDMGFLYGEKYTYVPGPLSPSEMAQYFKRCGQFWFPSFADPCPNTLIEALLCGCKPKFINSYGGQAEIIELDKHGYDWSSDRMAREYVKVVKNVT